MSQIISLGLENKIKNNRYSQFFSPNYKLHAKIPTFMLNAVEFIGSYMGIDNHSIYSHAIEETCDYISLLDSNNSLIDFRNEFKIEWVELSYNEYRVKTEPFLFHLENPFVYNLLLSEFKIPKKKVMNYLFGIYVQMFINEYNQTYNPDFRMIFPNKEEAKKNAIKNENLPLLRALNQFKRIDGFTRYGIIVKESLN